MVLLSVILLVPACSDDGDPAPPTSDPAPTTTSTTEVPAEALTGQLPCTRVASDAPSVPPADLERMVLPPPGPGWEPDYLRGFFMDNLELLEVAPPGRADCALLEATGRITGYHGAYETGTDAVLTGVHLFAGEEGAQTFLEAQAGHDGWFRVGRVVGHVEADDVAALVPRLRAQIEGVLADPTRGVLTAAQLASLPVPRDVLGEEYSAWPFDWFFGGLQANEERANNDPDPDGERDDLERTGRQASASAMWSPGSMLRVYTTVSQHRDAAGAADYLRDVAGERGGGVAVTGVGEEAVILREVGEGTTTTRLVFRRGALLGQVVDVRADDVNRTTWAQSVAEELDRRILALTPP